MSSKGHEKRGIVPCFYSPGGSSNLQLHVLAKNSTFQISLSPGNQGPHVTQCIIGPHKCTCRMASKSVEWFKQGAEGGKTTVQRNVYK